MPLASPHPNARPRIGVFDSGLGGLSVLRALRDRLPDVPCHYVADSGHAPYGERDDEHVLDRSTRIARHLVEAGAALIVVACNTATAAAVAALRDRWPAVPIVGLEPGLKPALAATRNGRIGVMATRATLASAKFTALLARQPEPQRFHLQPCDGLAGAIEALPLDDPTVLDLVERHVDPLRDAGVDTIVLGCTHYAFVREAIQVAIGPGATLIDTADAVARQTERLLKRIGRVVGEAQAADAHPALVVETTGEPSRLNAACRTWLALSGDARRIVL
ncbi:MAG: glutamate racemase [Proteobacteria bacterium]|nr:glutamate racemase [Pseudomonadota bacterium]